jgi:hypothetical protein
LYTLGADEKSVRRCVWTFCNKLHAKGRMPRDAPLSMEAYWQQVGSKLAARWQQVGSKMAARWQQDGSKMAARWQQDGSKMAANGQQSEVLGYMYLLVKEVPLDNYKRLKYP